MPYDCVPGIVGTYVVRAPVRVVWGCFGEYTTTNVRGCAPINQNIFYWCVFVRLYVFRWLCLGSLYVRFLQ